MTWRVLMLGTATAALTLTLGAAASAEDAPEIDYNRLGGYIEVAGVGSLENFSGGFSGATVGGVSLRLGNRFHQVVAVEFMYEYLDRRTVLAETTEAEMAISGTEVPTLTETEVYTHQITMNFRAYPWSSEESGFFHEIWDGRIQPYALTGFGAAIFDTPEGDDVGFVARFGAGLDFYVTKHIAVSGEVAYALSAGGAGSGARTNDKSFGGFLPLEDLDAASFSLGVTYRF